MIGQRFILLFLLPALVLAGCVGNVSDMPGQTDVREPVSSSAAEEETAIPSLCLGSWKRSAGNEGPETFTLLKDGICVLDGRRCTWTLEEGSYPIIRVWDGRQELFCFYGHFLGDSFREFGMLYRGVEDVLYFCPDKYEALVLTPSNWETYFEIQEAYSFGRDENGQAVNLRFARVVQLREEYAPLLSHMAASTLTLEYTARVGLATVTFPEGGEAFTLVPPEEAPVSGPYIWTADSKNGIFQRNLDGFSLDALEVSQVRLESDYRFIQVGGVLYLNEKRESG